VPHVDLAELAGRQKLGRGVRADLQFVPDAEREYRGSEGGGGGGGGEGREERGRGRKRGRERERGG